MHACATLGSVCSPLCRAEHTALQAAQRRHGGGGALGQFARAMQTGSDMGVLDIVGAEQAQKIIGTADNASAPFKLVQLGNWIAQTGTSHPYRVVEGSQAELECPLQVECCY